DVARLPEEIVDAFGDRHDITVRIARDIKPLAADPRALGLMKEECRRIVAERADLGTRISGPEIAKRLVRATVAPVQKAGGEAEIKGTNGKTMLRYTRSARSGLALRILPKSGAATDEILDAIRMLIE